VNDSNHWYLIAGILLLALLFGNSLIERWPLTPATIYLGIGFAMGPAGLNWLRLDMVADAPLVERIAEAAVLVSLFTSGLKLRAPWTDVRWRQPLALATLAMATTIGLIAWTGVLGLQLSIGAAVLLGAILAPTDPVLASAVQVRDPHDRDRLRFSLTGEAGMNDGTAFPFVILGLGLLGLHDLGSGWRWLAIEVVWKCLVGVVVGTVCGRVIAFLVLRMRIQRRETVGLDDLMALGLIALAYGLTMLIGGLGFLAVFFAGVALRATERQHSGDLPEEKVKAAATAREDDAATHHRAAPAYMAGAVLDFNEHVERICQLGVMLIVGTLVSSHIHPAALWFAPLLFLIIRPLSVLPTCFGAKLSRWDGALVSWFGVRGIGSIFYVAYAVNHGLAGPERDTIIGLTLTVVTASVLLHGISINGLMKGRERILSPPPRAD
jgi:NhaP-type Na+/H+ or K+/H+ antiporter